MLVMNSDLSQSANNDSGTAYRRNQVKSCCFLGILFICLLIALVLSLRAGSYNTPIAELVKGVFGTLAALQFRCVRSSAAWQLHWLFWA